MLRNIILVACLITIITSSSIGMDFADDINLYQIFISSQDDTDALAHMRPDVLCPVQDGYLVVAPSQIESQFASAQLNYTMVAGNINPGSLYRDIRMDQTTPLGFPVVFQERGVCIYAIDPPVEGHEDYASGLDPLLPRKLPIKFFAPSTKAFSINRSGDLDTLINRISQDTLTEYLEHLQSYDSRESGTSGNTASAYWIKDKLEDFGYDSVAFDTGTWEGYFDTYLNRNVLVYKQGSVYPYHQLIIGAHRDAVEDSPGADDNGSGTVAVMDIARALSDYDNRMTLIYILFDTEEKGLGGSKLYAQRAFSRGDKIELMMNFDMIGHYENENDVYACYGDPAGATNGQLWAHLADSIPGINLIADLRTSIKSDETSFFDYGYNVLWLFEYIFSTVYHAPNDSTSYIDFDYITRIVKTSLATIHTLDQNFVPDYELYLTGPECPEMLIPETITPIEVTILEYGGATLIPGSARLHYTIDGADSTAVEMTATGGGIYIADLPAIPCGHVVNYYVTAEDDSLGVVYYPDTEVGVNAIVTGDLTVLFDDDFELDLGWTVSGDASPSGYWTRTDPYINGNYYGAPPNDFDRNKSCYLTGYGSMLDVDGGTATLLSPVFDASAGNMLVQYARWYSNDQGGAPHTDVFEVSISNNNGVSWTLAETVGPIEQASGGWYVHQFLISSFLVPTAYMQLRFDASDLGEDSNVEAAIDAVKFIDLSDGPRITTRSLSDWTSGVPYSEQLEAIVCSGDVTWIDKDGNLNNNSLELSQSGLLEGTPTHSGYVFFTAEATGESDDTDEQEYSFSINPELTISTSSIPDGIIDEYMEQQLLASGGTGAHTWSDRDNILPSAGLTLSSSGVISGTPPALGDFSFTARVVDDIGAVAERFYNFIVREPFVCGDANGDTEANIGDAVFLIAYIFSGGPPPEPLGAGDANCDDDVNVGDAVYIINYVFSGGSEPCCP